MEALNLHYDVSGNDFTCAGEASGKIKKTLKELGFPNSTVRNVAIAVYEGEINMVIHAGGGVIDAVIEPECISLVLTDHGPGIPNVELAMKEGCPRKRASPRLRRGNGASEHQKIYRRNGH